MKKVFLKMGLILSLLFPSNVYGQATQLGLELCSSGTEGIIRYNNTKNNHEGCIRTADGYEWANMNGTLLDIAPNAFSFTNQTSLERSTLTTSNTVTLSGFDGPLAISCTNCSAISRNGVWGGTIVTGFMPNDTLAIRMTTSGSWSTAVTTDVVLGTHTTTWSITTRAQDTAPNAFSFTNQTGLERSTLTTSNSVTLSGFDGPLNATCSGCSDIARNGVWSGTTSATGFVSGDSITIRNTTSGSWSTAVNATVTVGSTASGTWSITTRAQDTTPNAFSFTNQTRLTANTLTTSNSVTLSGFDGPLNASCSGCSNIARNGIWTGTTSATGFVSGDSITIRATSSASDAGVVNVTATVGSTTSSTWTLTTYDTSVSGLSFSNQSNLTRSNTVSSNSATVSSFDGPLLMSVSGSGSPSMRVNGGSWVSSANINPGDSVQLRSTTSGSYGSTHNINYSVGVTSGTWSISTGTVYYGSWGGWSGCSASCDGGWQYNDRSCYFSGGGTVSCSECGGYCSDSSQCNTHPCYSYGWATGGWSGCSASCGGGYQTRSVWCQRSDGATVSDGYCGGGKPSDYQSGCNSHSCCSSNYGQACSRPNSWCAATGGATCAWYAQNYGTCNSQWTGSITSCTNGGSICCADTRYGTYNCSGTCVGDSVFP